MSAPGRGVCSQEGGGCLLLGGVPGSRGVSALGRTWSGGSAPEEVYLVLGGVCSWERCLLPGGWGCLLLGGVPGPRGVSALGVYLVLGGVCSWGGVPGPGGCLVLGGGVCSGKRCLLWGVPGQVLPSPCGQTHACKHITLPQTSFAGGKYYKLENLMLLAAV